VSRSLRLDAMTRDEARATAPGATLILPTAAIEQHGPHLPLVTDTLIAGSLADRVADRASERVEVRVAPVAVFGSSDHHLVFGALSLCTATFQALMVDLLTSAHRMGFRRIFVLNAHGGNDEIVRLAARDVALTHDVSIAANSYWTLAREPLARLWGPTPLPGHAGTFETSLMLALAPDLVRAGLRPLDVDHPRPISNGHVIAGSIARHGEWSRIDGYSDAPLEATAELGERVLAAVVDAVTHAVVAFHEATEAP
jgi:creatinine amidohydrolase